MDFVSRAALTALDAVSSLNNSTVDIPAGDGDVFANGTDVGEVFGNGTIVSPINVDVIDEGSYVLVSDAQLVIYKLCSGCSSRSSQKLQCHYRLFRSLREER